MNRPPEPKATGSNPVSRADGSRPGTKRKSKGARAASGGRRPLARSLPVLDAKPFKTRGGWECARCVMAGGLCADHGLAELRERVARLEAEAHP